MVTITDETTYFDFQDVKYASVENVLKSGVIPKSYIRIDTDFLARWSRRYIILIMSLVSP